VVACIVCARLGGRGRIDGSSSTVSLLTVLQWRPVPDRWVVPRRSGPAAGTQSSRRRAEVLLVLAERETPAASS